MIRYNLFENLKGTLRFANPRVPEYPQHIILHRPWPESSVRKSGPWQAFRNELFAAQYGGHAVDLNITVPASPGDLSGHDMILLANFLFRRSAQGLRRTHKFS